jgi:hypothetical protein
MRRCPAELFPIKSISSRRCSIYGGIVVRPVLVTDPRTEESKSMSWMKYARSRVVVALLGVAVSPRMANAQLLSPDQCPASSSVTASMAQARYAWGLWCRVHPLNSLGGTPLLPEHYLTAASLQAYTANPSLQPYLYPRFFNQQNFSYVDLPGLPGTDCSLLATSAFNVGLCVAGGGCADGAPEQTFAGGMVGCAGAAT